MIIGVAKEKINNESRIAITPAGAHMLRLAGHEVLVEKEAGAGSGFSDEDYIQEGVTIRSKADEIWKESDMVFTGKEPLPEEYKYLREFPMLFTSLHLAADETLTCT